MMQSYLRLMMIFLMALALTIMPMPFFLTDVRPPWVLLLILYLQFYLPYYFKMPMVFLTGLLLDVLLATVLGEHAFALSLTTWIASSKVRRFGFYTIGQQLALIGFFSFFYQLMILTIDGFLGFYVALFSLPGVSVMSVLLWPWVRLLLEETLLTKILCNNNRF